jgi:colanic acid/amylovoran biosynthesis glycosyltransferase
MVDGREKSQDGRIQVTPGCGPPKTRHTGRYACRVSHPVDRVLYALFRYPQLSQTFVRDEIHALRAAGVTVKVISLDDPGADAPPSTWAGPYEVTARPPAAQSARDLAWWLSRHPGSTLRFLAAIVREPGRRSYALRRIPTLARSLVTEDWRHVHSHFAWSTTTVAAALGILLDVPTTVTLHAKDIYAQPPATVRRRLSLLDGVATVCHFNVGYLAGSRALPSSLCPRVVSCGVAVPPSPRPAEDVQRTDVVTVGRLVRKKGVDVLLEAIANLSPRLTPAVTIVGDGPERPALEDLAARLGLSDRVTFTGSLPHHEALATIATARVFCLAARPADDADSDAMPVVIREAMAHGVPVITSRLTGIPESVDEHVGWVVDPGAIDDLAVALDEALTDPELAAHKGAAGRSRALERWSFAEQAGELRSLFGAVAHARLAAKPPAGPAVRASG